MRRLLLPIIMVGFFLLGIWAANNYLNPGPREYNNISANLVIQKIDQVCKLVTVEGTFEQRFDQENIKEFTLYLPLASKWRFSKKATLRVNGRVLVGYDMDQIEVDSDTDRKVIILRNLPDPTILAIDHNISYENLDESWFNTFKPQDFTALNINARKVLEKKAIEEKLLEEAKMEGNQVIEAMAFIAQSSGWGFEIEGYPSEPAPSSSGDFSN